MDCSRCCTREDEVHDVANGGRQCNAAAGAGARCYSWFFQLLLLEYLRQSCVFYGGYYVVGVWWWYIAGGEEDDGLEMGPEQGLLKSKTEKMKWVGLPNRENGELCDVLYVCFLWLLIKNPGNVTSIH
ncbi:hypothetical protein H0E87_012149 [Populus deltoides]|uniref:Uncharacterized protein n=1 Tax=Populus deltoides TaxID=3696 RepID=A0A8T2YI86_POPDE|nr:hypothetical protein H0E87_012149 [Populus deltoides]